MAHSPEKWATAKGYFEAGLSLREIEKRTGIANSQIQKEAKKKQWIHKKNANIIKAEVEIKKQKENLKETGDHIALDCLNEIANEMIIARQLISNAITDGVKEARKKMLKGEALRRQIDKDGNEYTAIQEYDQAQYKAYGEFIDKASITLGINQRHAAPQITQNNQNIQTDMKDITPPNESLKELSNKIDALLISAQQYDEAE